MTSISSVSSSLLQTSQTDELLRQQQLRDALKTSMDAAAKTLGATSGSLKDKLTSGSAPASGAQAVRGHGGHHGHHGGGKVVQSADDAAAAALDMTPSALKDALQSGQTLHDLAAAHNIDFSKVQGAISDAVKPQLDQAVQSGRLTSQQEHDLLSKLTSGGAASPNPSAAYSTSGSVPPASDAGLLVNTTV